MDLSFDKKVFISVFAYLIIVVFIYSTSNILYPFFERLNEIEKFFFLILSLVIFLGIIVLLLYCNWDENIEASFPTIPPESEIFSIMHDNKIDFQEKILKIKILTDLLSLEDDNRDRGQCLQTIYRIFCLYEQSNEKRGAFYSEMQTWISPVHEFSQEKLKFQKAILILNLPEDFNEEYLDDDFKNLLEQNDPQKIRGMDPEIVKFAEIRLKQITWAYEIVKRTKRA